MLMIHVFDTGDGTTQVDSGLPNVGRIFAIQSDGDLLWYQYNGGGAADRAAASGWVPNSGNPIGNGWQNFQHVLGCGDGVVLAIQPDGDLLWYRYNGDGTADRSGALGWHPNSGNPIGHGWQDFQHVTGGDDDSGGFGTVLYAVAKNGDMIWYRYDGDGTADRSGALGWHRNSGNPIGNGW